MSIKIVNAIKKINPNAVVSVGFENENGDSNNLNDVSLTWHDGTTPISVADIEAKMAELPTEEEETAQKETDAASGKQKLKDLGLTDAEIKALTGA